MQQRSESVTLIAVYNLLCGLGNLFLVCLFLTLPLIVAMSASNSRDGAMATAISGIVFLVGAGVFMLLAAANFAAGWGLWKQREWGRITAIVLAAIRLLNFPIGTIIGGLIIYFLLQPNVRAEFTSQSAPVSTELQQPG
jgi:hypothetical protein